MKNPICPYCKSDNVMIEQPHWNNTYNSKNPLRIEIQGYCINCGKNFEGLADTNFHSMRKIKQEE